MELNVYRIYLAGRKSDGKVGFAVVVSVMTVV